MDGIYLINKRRDWTSFDVVKYIRKHFPTFKVGHSGTLDPFATGLLIVLVGKATKLVPYLNELPKTYIATLKLGEATASLDSDSPITNRADVPVFDEEQINEVLQSFTGESMQTPPMVSALKKDGVPLYKLARQGIEVERKPRRIYISAINLLNYDSKNNLITFEAEVTSGTYIRTLGSDIASKLGTIGHLVALQRSKNANFNVEDAKDVSEIASLQPQSVVKALSHYKQVEVSDEDAQKIKYGQKLRLPYDEQDLIAISKTNEILAHLSLENKNENLYKIARGLFL